MKLKYSQQIDSLETQTTIQERIFEAISDSLFQLEVSLQILKKTFAEGRARAYFN